MTIDEYLEENQNAATLITTEHMRLGESDRRFGQDGGWPGYITQTGSYFIPRDFNDCADPLAARKDHIENERCRVLCQMVVSLENYFSSVAGPGESVDDWDLEVNPGRWMCETMIEVPNGANVFVEMEYRLVKRPVSATEAA